MISASLILGMLLSSLYGAVFHFWRGGSSGRLFLYLVLSWIGFLAGHYVATFLNINFGKVGELHVGIASIGSILLMAFGHWLGFGQIEHHMQK